MPSFGRVGARPSSIDISNTSGVAIHPLAWELIKSIMHKRNKIENKIENEKNWVRAAQLHVRELIWTGATGEPALTSHYTHDACFGGIHTLVWCASTVHTLYTYLYCASITFHITHCTSVFTWYLPNTRAQTPRVERCVSRFVSAVCAPLTHELSH